MEERSHTDSGVPLITRLVAWFGALDVGRTGILLLASVAVMAFAGVLSQILNKGIWWLGLDSEIVATVPLQDSTIAFPALWSGLLLIGAGVTWIAGASIWPHRHTRAMLMALGLFFLLMAGDEWVAVHESIEAWTRVDWQIIYAGPVLIMALAVLVILSQSWRVAPRSGVALLLGCAAWAAAQTLEVIQWNGNTKVPLYVLMMIPEELLEASGSALFCLAGLSLIHSLVAAESKISPSTTPATPPDAT